MHGNSSWHAQTGACTEWLPREKYLGGFFIQLNFFSADRFILGGRTFFFFPTEIRGSTANSHAFVAFEWQRALSCFSRQSHNSNSKTDSQVTILSGAWLCRASARNGETASIAKWLRRPPRERKIRDWILLATGFFQIESYQWLKNWYSSGYPTRRLAL